MTRRIFTPSRPVITTRTNEKLVREVKAAKARQRRLIDALIAEGSFTIEEGPK